MANGGKNGDLASSHAVKKTCHSTKPLEGRYIFLLVLNTDARHFHTFQQPRISRAPSTHSIHGVSLSVYRRLDKHNRYDSG